MGDKFIEVDEIYKDWIVNQVIKKYQMVDPNWLILMGHYQNLENLGKIKGENTLPKGFWVKKHFNFIKRTSVIR